MATALITPSSCEAFAATVGFVSAGVSVLGVPASASDSVASSLETWQFVLGEGPSSDAHRSQQAVEVVVVPSVGTPWPAFDEHLVAAGIRHVFAHPVRLGGGGVATLTFYGTCAGTLEPHARAAAASCARETARVLDGVGARRDGWLADSIDEMHRAAGLVAARLGVAPDEALSRLRGHSFATGCALPEVVRAVLEDRLRLSRDH